MTACGLPGPACRKNMRGTLVESPYGTHDGGVEVNQFLLAAMIALSTAWAVEDDPQFSRLQAVGENGVVVDLPLEHTSVDISVTGNIQRAVVRQVYGNPFDEPIEAVYVFPLPDDAAVDAMTMLVGDRQHRWAASSSVTRPGPSTSRPWPRARPRPPRAGAAQHLHPVGRQHPARRPRRRSRSATSTSSATTSALRVSIPDGRRPALHPRALLQGSPAPGGPSTRYWSRTPSRITPHVVPEGTRAGYDIDLSVTMNTGFPCRADPVA